MNFSAEHQRVCDWLTCAEWCDVRLQCGGRAFNAHRAVLASVSIFLRKILLSTSIDESPTFIVLPDFDLEAMSSVLYYIYNGEVVIQKHKLEMFLEIVKALQIFIDFQYLPQLDSPLQDYVCDKSNFPKYEKPFALGSRNSNDYINVRKGCSQDMLQQTFVRLDIKDKQTRHHNGSEQYNPCLGNLQSLGDRQRNSFLRDLFIETYPRNGNGNGLAAGVLAISNEVYRAPTSKLLTNANGKHLAVDATLSDSSKETTERAHLSDGAHARKQVQAPQSKYFSHYLKNVCSQHNMNFNPQSNVDYLAKYYHTELPQKNMHLPSTVKDCQLLPKNMPKAYDFASPLINPRINIKNITHYNPAKIIENTDSKCDMSDNVCREPRVPISNQVLGSPWCPRQPINYIPSRKKDYIHSINLKKDEKLKDKEESDSNNNVEATPKVLNLENTHKLIEETLTDTPRLVDTESTNISVDDNLKCTICNQGLSNSEALSNHMQRHTNSRYSCAECGKTFSQLRNYKYHVSIHRGTREFAATCTVCGKYFNDRGYLSSHMKIHRNRKEYKCSQCPKSFNQRVAYNMHVRIHTGVKPHVCPECGKAFSRKMLLKQHQRTHSGERPYACPHCDKRFADRSNMTLHLRLHTGVKPFSCTLCPKSFTKKHHLKSHLNFHTGAKPYACPRCKLAFTQSSNMRTHLKKCTAPEPSPGTA